MTKKDTVSKSEVRLTGLGTRYSRPSSDAAKATERTRMQAGRAHGPMEGHRPESRRFAHGVLKSKKLGVSEVADAVQAAAYRTSSANFRVIVN